MAILAMILLLVKKDRKYDKQIHISHVKADMTSWFLK